MLKSWSRTQGQPEDTYFAELDAEGSPQGGDSPHNQSADGDSDSGQISNDPRCTDGRPLMRQDDLVRRKGG